jgi:hypothetical protein
MSVHCSQTFDWRSELPLFGRDAHDNGCSAIRALDQFHLVDGSVALWLDLQIAQLLPT